MSGATQPEAGRPDGLAWQLFTIAAASAFSPLMVWANAGESPNPLDLVLVWASVSAIGMLLRYLLVRIGLDPTGTTYAVSAVILVVMNTGVLIAKFPLGRTGLLLFAAFVVVLLYRLRGLGALRFVMTWVVFLALVYPVVTIIGRFGFEPAHLDNLEGELVVSGMITKPDVVVIVADAYGGADVLDEFFEFDNTPFLNELADFGFDTGQAVTANYARTQLSVPSVLQMEYITGEGAISDGDLRGLLRVISGGNNVVNALQDQGYRHVYVESGWLGTVCGAEVDVCVAARWPDETMYDSAYRTLLRGLPGFELGRSFAEGALHTIDWMNSDLATYLNDDQPDIIFIHLLVPHPPMFLGSDCTPNWRNGFPGFAVGRPEMDEETLAIAADAYIQQVECVNSTLQRFAENLGPDDVVLIIGDHGPDSQGQLFLSGTKWSEEQRRERYSVLFAARVPGCDMSSIESLVNVARRTLSCLSLDQFADLPTERFDMERSPEGNRVFRIQEPS